MDVEAALVRNERKTKFGIHSGSMNAFARKTKSARYLLLALALFPTRSTSQITLVPNVVVKRASKSSWNIRIALLPAKSTF